MTTLCQIELDTAVCLCTDVCTKEKERQMPNLKQRLAVERQQFLIVFSVSVHCSASVQYKNSCPEMFSVTPELKIKQEGVTECVIIVL